MNEVEGKSKGAKRAATDEAGENGKPKKDLFEPPIKRSNKEMRFQSKSQDEEKFRNWLKNEPARPSNALPELESESDDSDATIRGEKEDKEDFA